MDYDTIDPTKFANEVIDGVTAPPSNITKDDIENVEVLRGSVVVNIIFVATVNISSIPSSVNVTHNGQVIQSTNVTVCGKCTAQSIAAASGTPYTPVCTNCIIYTHTVTNFKYIL